MKDKMYICPKAKECSKNCFHKFKHEFEFGTCTYSGEDCPACIPYSTDTCPDKSNLKWRCKRAIYADVDSSSGGCDGADGECEKCPDREYICATCGKPLVDTLETGNPDGDWTCLDCGYELSHNPADLQPKQCTNLLISRKDSPYTCEGNCEGCDYWKSEQPTQMPLQIGMQIQPESWVFSKEALEARDSAMAAQAVKEFAGQVITEFYWLLDDKLIKRIWAMAEGKE